MKLTPIEYPNRLETTAEHLARDGHTDLAAEYRARAETATVQRGIVDSLGEVAARRYHAAIPQARTGIGPHAEFDRYGYGLELAQWLVEKGWTPPAPLAVEGLGDILANVGSTAR